MHDTLTDTSNSLLRSGSSSLKTEKKEMHLCMPAKKKKNTKTMSERMNVIKEAFYQS